MRSQITTSQDLRAWAEGWGVGQVLEAVVLRDQAGQSRRYGFVAFTHHALLTHVLSQIGNHPDKFIINDKRVRFSVDESGSIGTRVRLQCLGVKVTHNATIAQYCLRVTTGTARIDNDISYISHDHAPTGPLCTYTLLALSGGRARGFVTVHAQDPCASNTHHIFPPHRTRVWRCDGE